MNIQDQNFLNICVRTAEITWWIGIFAILTSWIAGWLFLPLAILWIAPFVITISGLIGFFVFLENKDPHINKKTKRVLLLNALLIIISLFNYFVLIPALTNSFFFL